MKKSNLLLVKFRTKGAKRLAKYKNPIASISDNLLFTDKGECWAYYQIEPQNIHAGNVEKLQQSKNSLEQLITRLAKFKEIDLFMTPVEMNMEERFDYLEKDYDPDMLEIGHYYNQRTLDVLKDELGTITESSFTIGVKIKKPFLSANEGKSGFIETVKQLNKSLLSVFGFSGISESEMEAFENKESDVRDLFYDIEYKPLTENQLRYLCRYNFIRGLPHEYVYECNRAKKNISDTLLDSSSEPRYLRIEGEYGESYCSFIPIERTDVDFTGADLFRSLQDFDFPVEMRVKMKLKSKNTLERDITLTKKRFNETSEELADKAEADETLSTGAEDLSDLKNEISNERTPFFNWIGCVVVTGDSKEQCKERAKEVKLLLDNEYKIVGTQPIADQLDLFYLYLPGTSFNPVSAQWVQSSLPVGIAEMQFSVSQRLGNRVGQYIGRITNGIYSDLTSAIMSSRFSVLTHFFIANEGIPGAATDSPHTLVTGDTGNGKSFFTKMILLYLSFLKGKTLFVDPKSEIKLWFDKVLNDPVVAEKYPMFIKLIRKIHYVTLDAEDPANQGVLDPLTFLSGKKAKDTALSMLHQIFNFNDDVESEVIEILNQLTAEGELNIRNGSKTTKVGLKMLYERLEQNSDEEIKKAGILMRRKVEGSIIELAFSDGNSKSLNLNKKISVLQIEGLELPESDITVDQMSVQDHYCLALMIPLARFCQEFGMRNKQEKTTIIFDEAWILTKAHGGKRLINQLLRVGRSFSNQLILVTQSVSDVESDNERSNFGMAFCFDEEANREKVFDFLKLEDSEYNNKLVAGFKKGQCFFRDIYGAVGQLSIDCPFDEWKMAFKTVEKSKSAEAEMQFS